MVRRVGRVVHPHLFDRSLYLDRNVPIGGTAHRAGILVFGEDSATSVLDRDCKPHELDTPYVTDATLPLPLEPRTRGNRRQDVEGKVDLVRSGASSPTESIRPIGLGLYRPMSTRFREG